MIRNRKQFSAWVIGLLALSLAGCSEAEVLPATTPGDDPLAGDPTRREVILGFQNKLNIKMAGTDTHAATTRADDAIATTEENEITSLDIYVFSSDKEEGPYTYQERFCYRADGSTIPNATKIILTVEGNNVALATLRPKKGLFTKFYCIANQPKLLKAGAEYTVFTPLEQSSPGADYNIVTKAGIPTETDFLTFTTPLLDPATDTDILLPPLPMVGSYSPALDLRDISMGSRTRINMTLSRIVSRFDIINDEKLSHLTITDVSMGHGRKGVTFFPVVPVEDADPDKTLITYPDRDFDGVNANKGTQTGAFYSYPSPIADKGYLIIKGKYALNMTDVPQEVSYMVNFEQSVAGTGGYIEVKPNHRYTVRITDADPFKLDVNITVSDWTDGGDFEYQPENELAIGTLAGVGATAIEDNNKATVSPDETEYFSIPFTSNSETECSIVYTNSAGGSAEWLKTAITKDVVTRAGSVAYTCKVSKNTEYTGNLFPKAIIVLRSKAGREESQISVKAAVKVPTVAAATGTPSEPTGVNSYVAGSEAPDVITGVLNMQKQENAGTTSSMKLTVTAKGGSRISGLPTWLKADKAVGHATEAIDYTLTLDQNAKDFPTTFPADAAATFEIQNLSDAAKKVTVTVNVTETTIVP
ncbi:fimbrial protein [uncultured Bacteroides sp.]|uniref:fimbrial protein n=1 Tax=uncultured Bacteroides sp. TaxID=162156 RepID=UPI0026354C30|nr:fimbrial protein [uncultured Bacteroides sp.]